MKKYLKLILIMILPLLVSCAKEGGYWYRDIYVLVGDVPVDAQNYVLTIPADAGEYDVPFLTNGHLSVLVEKPCPGLDISVENHDDNMEDYAYLWGYKENLHIKADANTQIISRKLKCSIISQVGNWYKADMTIVQQGK